MPGDRGSCSVGTVGFVQIKLKLDPVVYARVILTTIRGCDTTTDVILKLFLQCAEKFPVIALYTDGKVGLRLAERKHLTNRCARAENRNVEQGHRVGQIVGQRLCACAFG